MLSLPSLNNTKRYIGLLERFGIKRDKLKLVVNRYLDRSEISIKEAEAILNYPVFMTIPNDYASALAAINKGEPLVRLFPRSPVSKMIGELSKQVKALSVRS